MSGGMTRKPDGIVGGMTVREGRDRFLADHSLDLDSYTAPGYLLAIGRLRVPLPNPGLLSLHDLHHVATGFGSGLLGEAEVSAFELRAGCRSFMVHILCIGAVLLGMIIAPRRIMGVWKRSRGARTLYHTAIPYDALLDMDLVELRQLLGIPPGGLSRKAVERA